MRRSQFFNVFQSCSILSLYILLLGCTPQQTIENNSNSAPTSSVSQSEKNEKNDSAFTMFATPSGNIHCALLETQQGDKLRCEIQSMLNPIPPQSENDICEFDWGAGFLLPKSGKPAILCISDTIAGSDRTLEYGSTWTHSGFDCKSETIGLTCTNANKQGFFLSREKWQTF